MNNVKPILALSPGRRARLAIFMSGSGSNAERIMEKTAASTDPPCEIVALVTDAPETSRARELADHFGLMLIEHDIRRFYAEHGESRVSIATPRGQELREAWTNELRSRLAPLDIDFGVFAGFVPLTNLTGDFPCLNVHPGDLTYLKDGSRYLVGLHTVPIERAILEGLDCLRSSVIQALPYSGQGDDMDNGPILGISEEVPIDLGGMELTVLQACLETRPERRPKDGFGDCLEAVARKNLDRLKTDGDWTVLPAVVFDFARGRFGTDDSGELCYRIGGKWHPIETVVYGPDFQEVIFRTRPD